MVLLQACGSKIAGMGNISLVFMLKYLLENVRFIKFTIPELINNQCKTE